MAKGPAVVFVARHGARLDAADKTWHLTSPTPYDPPLTYGGWSQGKALGLRIAALLHERDNEQAEAAKNGLNADLANLEFSKLGASRVGTAHGDGLPRPKKKRKIVIHSSPYLRCVQTSTAVAAGLSQYRPPNTSTPHLKVPTPAKHRDGHLGSSSSAISPRSKSPYQMPTTIEPLADPNLEVFPKSFHGPKKTLLRIDAFLGEWLSPDYFEDITSPPNSTMMVAGAKADLLRRGDYIQEQPDTHSSRGHFPGGWAKGGTTGTHRKSTEDGTFPSMSRLAQVSPFRERSSSYGSTLALQKTRSREAVVSLVPSPPQKTNRVYEAPVPSYSVSPADPIPRGYFAHAREACVEVDFQWDSMRPPQDWGDGGEYGDEWSTMHKRFRRGLSGMMQWYKEHGSTPPKDQFPGFMFKVLSNKSPPPISHHTSDPFPRLNDGLDSDDDEELVLVLITHGAGCNALLGAISNQPVLIDVGLASLSMAVRRAEPRKPSVSTIHERRLSVADPGMAETYEMKLLASTDHLRPGVDPSRPPQAQSQANSPAVVPSPSIDSRRRFTGSPAANSPIDSPFTLGEPYRSWNSSLGSVRRTMSSGSNSRYMKSLHSTSGAASPSTGLWSGSRTPNTDAGGDGHSSPNLDMLNFANQLPKPKPTTTTTSIPALDGASEPTNGLSKLDSKEEKETSDNITPLVKAPARTGSTSSSGLWGAKAQPKSGNGLWGPPKLDDVYEHGRGPKRRWTVTEREESL
ncbi:Nn.00g047600.m01.CDS01 [Neocucurbitaria sp. VM-36]